MWVLFTASFLLFAMAFGQTLLVTKVNFASQGVEIAGDLYLPDDYNAAFPLPGVVVTGALTTVKEQMSGGYAKALADWGFAALVFDFRGWGESKETAKIKFYEHPGRKIEDILAAVEYLKTRHEVDKERMALLAVCASSGYALDASQQTSSVRAVAVVAPRLHSRDVLVREGGEERLQQRLDIGKEAKDLFDSTGEYTLITAGSTTDPNAYFYKTPYYSETSRGLIPEYDNVWSQMSWVPWYDYDPISRASNLSKPTLAIHSQSAVVPYGLEDYISKADPKVLNVIWKDNITQFDFYDRPDLVRDNTAVVAKHFAKAFQEKEITVTKVKFVSKGVELTGNLHLPEDFNAGNPLPGVVVTGALTTIKEQMSGLYAGALAQRGFATLAFDFRGWGQSKDGADILYYEHPGRKTEDILAAVEFLKNRDEVDKGRLALLAVGASSGYALDASQQTSSVGAVAVVAPRLHNRDVLVREGGEERLQQRLDIGKEAKDLFDSTGKYTLITAGSRNDSSAYFYRTPYYSETTRGLIPEYDNVWSQMSWVPWYEYDPISRASTLETPTLAIHSDSAVVPYGLKDYVSKADPIVLNVIWRYNNQFEFYDRPDLVRENTALISNHFDKVFEFEKKAGMKESTNIALISVLVVMIGIIYCG